MESQITILLIYSDRGCPSPDKCRHLCVGEWGKVSVPDRGCPSPDPSFITPCLTRSKNAKIQNLSPIHMFLRLFTEVLNVLYDKRMSHFINAFYHALDYQKTYITIQVGTKAQSTIGIK